MPNKSFLKKVCFFACCAIFVVSVLLSYNMLILTRAVPAPAFVVALDPGHGGIDGGTVGVTTGKDENYLNLCYAKTLQTILQNYGISAPLTRKNLGGLYSPFAQNKKLDDMEKRVQAVKAARADVLVSIHMNSFPLSSTRGAQVFFRAEDENSCVLAECIQQVFVQTLPLARPTTSVGDYYILNELDIPCVIVECGYLSNPEEEALLVQEEYQNLVCGAIFVGVLRFLAR